MIYENFDQVVTIKKQLDKHFELVKELELIKKYSESDPNNRLRISVRILTLESYIPERFETLTIEYINKVLDQIHREILELKQQLAEL